MFLVGLGESHSLDTGKPTLDSCTAVEFNSYKYRYNFTFGLLLFRAYGRQRQPHGGSPKLGPPKASLEDPLSDMGQGTSSEVMATKFL